MHLLVASLLGGCVFVKTLRNRFLKFLYLSKYITIFLMGSKLRRGCGTFSHSSLNYSCKQQNLKITRISVTVTLLDRV